ncbi:MAG: hypothetical protein N2691_01070 [Patescibacteria group bacterium]|nr:hypothetical protein [Patescibacteria group bacterium]
MQITPDKYRDVVRLVRGRKPLEAVHMLENINKKAARSLRKIILSAIANARNSLNVGDDMLEFKLFTIEEGNRLKRFRAVSRGMAKAFYRRMSHVKIILTTTEDAVVTPVTGQKKQGTEKKTAKEPVSARPGQAKEVKPDARTAEKKVTISKVTESKK